MIKVPNRIPWPPVLFLAAIALALILHWLAPLPWPTDVARLVLAAIGLGLMFAGIVFDVAAFRQFRKHLKHPHDRLFFIIGADAFLHLPTWRSYEELLDSCDFIVASRPGFRLEALRLIVPPELLGRPDPARPADRRTIVLRRTAVHLLDNVTSHVSATEIRRRLKHRQSIRGLVPVRVEEYILKQALYT